MLLTATPLPSTAMGDMEASKPLRSGRTVKVQARQVSTRSRKAHQIHTERQTSVMRRRSAGVNKRTVHKRHGQKKVVGLLRSMGGSSGEGQDS